jgi:hypothetical protein
MSRRRKLNARGAQSILNLNRFIAPGKTIAGSCA